MRGRQLLAALLCAAQVISLPLSNQMNEDDAKVMNCIVEVISATLSKPHPLPISAECLDTLQGDERIISILRHQNLLKELQELATQGAREREKQEKKNQGFEDELSEVLESQKERSIEGADKSEEASSGEQAFTEAAEEKMEQTSEKDAPQEREGHHLEAREPSGHETNPEEKNDDKQKEEEFEYNGVGEAEEMEKKDDGLDNHITDGLEEEPPKKKSQESEVQSKDHTANLELEEEKDQEENKKEVAKSLKEHEDEHDAFDRESRMETDKSSSRGEDEEEEDETQQEESLINASENRDVMDVNMEGKNSEDKGGLPDNKGDSYRSKEEDVMQRGGNSHEKETEGEPSREWEDAKRWNKMDELAKELTTRKRMEEHGSHEEPDQSMKIPFKTHKYDFQNQESDVRRSWQQHSKDSGEKELQISVRPDPEEKKEEEGSANRRTEDQELEALAAIEAELEKVAHKLHKLRSG